MSEDKAIDKIKKLLALQESAQKLGNIEEAANAADKVKRILLKYNLDQDVINQVENPIILETIDLKEFGYNHREGDWLMGLSSQIAEFFISRAFFMRRGNDGRVLQLVGPATNNLVVIDSIRNLSSAIRHFAREEFKKEHSYGMKKGTFMRSYYQGAVMGLGVSIRRIKEMQDIAAKAAVEVEVEGSMVPMVLLNQLEIKERDEIDKYIEDNIEYSTKTKKRRPTDNAMVQGYQKGLELEPQRSIG